MQRYKCKSCGKSISKVQFESSKGICGVCKVKKPSPRFMGRKVW